MTIKKNRPSRVIGIDYGMARIGLAVSDERGVIASPLKTVQADRKSEKTVTLVLEEIERYTRDYECEIKTIVVGLPLMMNGTVGYIADEVSHFIKLLKKKTSTPIETLDERLTSVQAERSLREGGMSSKKQKKHVDSVAAVLILQNYLDRQQFMRDQESLL